MRSIELVLNSFLSWTYKVPVKFKKQDEKSNRAFRMVSEPNLNVLQGELKKKIDIIKKNCIKCGSDSCTELKKQ